MGEVEERMVEDILKYIKYQWEYSMQILISDIRTGIETKETGIVSYRTKFQKLCT